MKKLLEINNKSFLDIDTTVLISSNYNYNSDVLMFLNNSCEVIIRNKTYNLEYIPNNILLDFNCTYLKKKKVLTKIDYIKVNLLNSLISQKKIIVFFNVLDYIDQEFKNKLLKELKKQDKRIINYTSEIEEVTLLDYLIVIKDNKIVMEGTTKNILKEEKILKKLGFNLPFSVELSIGLKYYKLIKELYYDNESLVNELWN